MKVVILVYTAITSQNQGDGMGTLESWTERLSLVVRSSCRAGTRDLCPAMAALFYIFPQHTLFHFDSPSCPASWVCSRTASPILTCVFGHGPPNVLCDLKDDFSSRTHKCNILAAVIDSRNKHSPY
jgi:hypothetical protein